MELINGHLFKTDQNLALHRQVEQLFESQTKEWPLLRKNIVALNNIEKRHIGFNGFGFDIQHNPARKRSTCADTRKTAIEKRPCFLCLENLPIEQKGMLLLNRYLLLANPYPIFERHLTISDINHTPQNMDERILDMLEITRQLENFTVFYNGPACGASAPDHFHFQACPFGAMPIDIELDKLPSNSKKELYSDDTIQISHIANYLRNVFVFTSTSHNSILSHYIGLKKQLPFDVNSGEPMFNLMCNYRNGEYRTMLFPRIAQRPACYFKTGPQQIVVSVASVELGGIIVTPRHEDYLKITKDDLVRIFDEVCLK